MKGDLRCVDGHLMRHDPQYDDPYLETDVGQCPDCSGSGCGDEGEPVSKAGMRYTPVRCNMCDWRGEEADLIMANDSQDGALTNAACPKCMTDHFLADWPKAIKEPRP